MPHASGDILYNMTAPAPVEIETLITRTPGVYGGKPCLAGTRFPILEIASRYTAGASAQEIASDAQLPLAHVHAGIAYYLVNKAAIDTELDEERQEYDAALRAYRSDHAASA